MSDLDLYDGYDGQVKGFSRSVASISMIKEALREYAIVYWPETTKRWFSCFAAFPTPNRRSYLASYASTLFLCCQDNALDLLETYKDCMCVVLVKDLSWLQNVNQGRFKGRCIVVHQDRRFSEYYIALTSLFMDALMWYSAMERIVYQRGTIEQLVSVSETVFGSFLGVLDNGFNIIAATKDPDILNKSGLFREYVEQGCLGSEEIRYIQNAIISKASPSSVVFYCEPDKNSEYGTLHYPLFVDNMFLFHVVLVCSTENRKYFEDLLSRFIKNLEIYCKDYWHSTVDLEARWHRVLVGIIDGVATTEEYRKIQLELTEIPFARRFRLCYCNFDDDMPYKKRIEAVKAAEKLNNGLCYPFMYKGLLLVLCYEKEAGDESCLSDQMLASQIRRVLYEPFGIVIGASQIFNDVSHLRLAFRQAKISYEMKDCILAELSIQCAQEIPVCFSFEYAISCYMLKPQYDEELIQFTFDNGHLRQLIEEDKKNGTNIARLLVVYLLFERNATKTAKHLHVHRNTVIYHIERVEQRFHISLDNSLLRNAILMAWRWHLGEITVITS